MITGIQIRNFKSLKDIKISTKPLNLLMGLNGMGKSSLIQSLLLLHQSKLLQSGRLLLNDKFVQIGKGKDAFYQFSQTDVMEFELAFSNSNKKANWKFKYTPESDFFDKIGNESNTGYENESLFSTNFQYLNAERRGPREVYKTSPVNTINEKQLGNFGEFTVHYLNVFGNNKLSEAKLMHPKAKSETLIHQTDSWLGEISPGVKLNTREIPGTDNVILDFQFGTGDFYTNSFRPTNVGFGLSYVLPIIVALLSAQKNRIIIIENPESHIHPRGQAELGRLMALAASTGAQLFVETHSDHILNGLRVAVKKGHINKDNVGLFYFEKVTNNEEQYSKITSIQVDRNGELDGYPVNFLDEWNNQLFNLM
jgi:predicted ATPase